MGDDTVMKPRPHPVPPGFKILPPVSPFFRTLGKVYILERPGQAPVYGLHVRPKHANRHGTGHGGFLATLADTFMAAFVHHQRREIGTMWTIRLNMEYKRPAPMGAWLECHLAEIRREGAFVTVDCVLQTGPAETPVITNKATAVFKVADREPA